MAEYFKHPNALVESEFIGPGTRVWAFAHILPGAVVGRDCNICDHTFIENKVTIGDRVTIKCGVQVWDGITLEDDVFVGPNVTFTNDRFPRSRRHLADYPALTVRAGASIGANATILPGLEIGEGAMIGAGAVVVKDVPAKAIVVGNPGRVVGFDDPHLSGGDKAPLIVLKGLAQARAAGSVVLTPALADGASAGWRDLKLNILSLTSANLELKVGSQPLVAWLLSGKAYLDCSIGARSRRARMSRLRPVAIVARGARVTLSAITKKARLITGTLTSN